MYMKHKNDHGMSLRDLAQTLTDVLANHDKVPAKVSKSIVVTYMEALTHGVYAMQDHPVYGRINALVANEPEPVDCSDDEDDDSFESAEDLFEFEDENEKGCEQ